MRASVAKKSDVIETGFVETEISESDTETTRKETKYGNQDHGSDGLNRPQDRLEIEDWDYFSRLTASLETTS